MSVSLAPTISINNPHNSFSNLFSGSVEVGELVARLGVPRDPEHGAETEEGLLEAIAQIKRVVAVNQDPARLGLVDQMAEPMELDPRLPEYIVVGANIAMLVLAGKEVRRDQVSFKVSLGIL